MKNDKNVQISIIIIITIFIVVLILSKDKIQIKPDCDFQPLNVNCMCYDGNLKVMIDNEKYGCKKTECTNRTLFEDCITKYHIGCVGEWSCYQGDCVWLCTK